MVQYKKTASRRGWKFTEKDFEVAKQLLGMNLGAQQVANVTGWGKATISRAAATDTYVDYIALTRSYTESIRVRQQAARAAKQIKEIQYSKTPETPHFDEASVYPTPEPTSKEADVKVAVDSVERIAIALERLADAWESAPKKKGIFS